MPKNYYIILGIPTDSSQREIKTAYRRLARKYHPDYYGANQEPFQTIQEAYTVLSDPASRRSYDNTLQTRVATRVRSAAYPAGNNTPVEPLIPDDQGYVADLAAMTTQVHEYRSPFDTIFDRLLGSFLEYPAASTHPEDSLTIEIPLSREQAAQGGNVKLSLPVAIRCPSCLARGVVGFYDCWRCNGTGRLIGEQPLLISYPPDIQRMHATTIATRIQDGRQLYLTVVFQVVRGPYGP